MVLNTSEVTLQGSPSALDTFHHIINGRPKAWFQKCLYSPRKCAILRRYSIEDTLQKLVGNDDVVQWLHQKNGTSRSCTQDTSAILISLSEANRPNKAAFLL